MEVASSSYRGEKVDFLWIRRGMRIFEVT